jgi:hypothetical protein
VISALLTAQIITCPTYNVVNFTQEWNKIDAKSLQSAINRCSTLFKDAPCLRDFIKKEENLYNVVCTQKIPEKKVMK